MSSQKLTLLLMLYYLLLLIDSCPYLVVTAINMFLKAIHLVNSVGATEAV